MKHLFSCLILLYVALMPVAANADQADSTAREQLILVNPHQQPYYLNGGNEGLSKDLYSALRELAPAAQECLKGKVVISFIITKEGLIDPDNIKVVRNKSVPEEYVTAAIEAIKRLGKFEPGKMNGKPINVCWIQPVSYPIPADSTTSSK